MDERRHNADMVEHISLLTALASECGVAVEFGMRGGISTQAIARGIQRRLVSYDVDDLECDHVHAIAGARKVEFEFRKQDSRTAPVEGADMLFVDSEHTYECLSAELERHGAATRKYIVVHDTNRIPLREAVADWLTASPQWGCRYDLHNCYGLMVLARV